MRDSPHKLFKLELQSAVFKKRLNRFVVLADSQDRQVYLHLTNTGRLTDLLTAGVEILYLGAVGGKTVGRIVGVVAGDGTALIDTLLQRRAFEAAYNMGLIDWLKGFSIVEREAQVKGRRIDYLLKTYSGRRLYLELKSAVYLREDGAAMYPDTVSERGRQYIKLLASLAKKHLACVVFIAAHPFASFFTPCDIGDPLIRSLLVRACSKGVQIKAIKTYIDTEGWVVLADPDLPVYLGR
jgi:sugar fermentation stimulation protein A